MSRTTAPRGHVPVLAPRFGPRLGVVGAAKPPGEVLPLSPPPEQRRATVAAELAGRDVRGPEARRLTLGDLECLAWPGHVRRQRAAGLAPALATVTEADPEGLARHAIAKRAAEAARPEVAVS